MTQSVVVEIQTVGQRNSLNQVGLLALQAGVRSNSCTVAVPSRSSSLAVNSLLTASIRQFSSAECRVRPLSIAAG